MDFLLSYEDGSSAYLSHYGVKGMHWGVWNAETRARRSGTREKRRLTPEQKERYKELAKTTLKTAAVAGAVIGGRMLVGAVVTSAFGPVAGAGAVNTVNGIGRLTEIAANNPTEYQHIVDVVMQGHSNSATPGNWANYGTPSSHGVQPHAHPQIGGNVYGSNGQSAHYYNGHFIATGQSIVEQLMNADIPDSLKRK